jgi:hypothetical protein
MEQTVAEEWLRLRGPTISGAAAYQEFITTAGKKDFLSFPPVQSSAIEFLADMPFYEELFEYLSMREIADDSPGGLPASMSVVREDLVSLDRLLRRRMGAILVECTRLRKRWLSLLQIIAFLDSTIDYI